MRIIDTFTVLDGERIVSVDTDTDGVPLYTILDNQSKLNCRQNNLYLDIGDRWSGIVYEILVFNGDKFLAWPVSTIFNNKFDICVFDRDPIRFINIPVTKEIQCNDGRLYLAFGEEWIDYSETSHVHVMSVITLKGNDGSLQEFQIKIETDVGFISEISCFSMDNHLLYFAVHSAPYMWKYNLSDFSYDRIALPSKGAVVKLLVPVKEGVLIFVEEHDSVANYLYTGSIWTRLENGHLDIVRLILMKQSRFLTIKGKMGGIVIVYDNKNSIVYKLD